MASGGGPMFCGKLRSTVAGAAGRGFGVERFGGDARGRRLLSRALTLRRRTIEPDNASMLIADLVSRMICAASSGLPGTMRQRSSHRGIGNSAYGATGQQDGSGLRNLAH